MSIKSSAALLTCALLGTGCQVGPNYHHPVIDSQVSADFVAPVSTPVLRSVTSNWALTTQWWQLYPDEQMDRLAQEAIRSNLDLKVAVAHLRAAFSVLSEAKAGRFPVTTETVGANYGRDALTDGFASSLGGKARNDWTYSGEFDISYEVDLFGRVERSIRAARSDAQ